MGTHQSRIKPHLQKRLGLLIERRADPQIVESNQNKAEIREPKEACYSLPTQEIQARKWVGYRRRDHVSTPMDRSQPIPEPLSRRWVFTISSELWRRIGRLGKQPN
jgi:hypothetical protein